MSEERSPTLDLNGDYIEHLHLLSSDEAGWDGLHLIYEREPAGEMPGGNLGLHLLTICLGEFHASYE
ncbi:AraC family transcriptional regulator, partial [Oscillatoriales cyanobacterium LEGE 11467]|nr:AraC family transcriptional regulator [Zarconia navalis LEGE 11467]